MNPAVLVARQPVSSLVVVSHGAQKTEGLHGAELRESTRKGM